MSNPTLVIATTTVSNEEQARRLAGEILTRRCAACVQIDGPISSHYVWQGSLQQEIEWRLTIKTTAERQADLGRFVHDRHPYEVPQWLVSVVAEASAAYAEWVAESVTPAAPSAASSTEPN